MFRYFIVQNWLFRNWIQIPRLGFKGCSGRQSPNTIEVKQIGNKLKAIAATSSVVATAIQGASAASLGKARMPVLSLFIVTYLVLTDSMLYRKATTAEFSQTQCAKCETCQVPRDWQHQDRILILSSVSFVVSSFSAFHKLSAAIPPHKWLSSLVDLIGQSQGKIR